MSSLLQMNKFEIVDMPGMNTLAFLIEKSYSDQNNEEETLTLEKIRSVEVQEQGQIKKIFNVLVDEPDDENDIVLLTLTDRKAYLSMGVLDQNGFRTEETNIPLSYGSIYNVEGIEYKEVSYTPDLRRSFSIIDSQTGEEVKPSLYKDGVTGEVKGRCKLMPNRPYIVLEVVYNEDSSSNEEEDLFSGSLYDDGDESLV